MWKHLTAGRQTVLQISLLQPTEQLSVTADFRALLRQDKLKWFNMQGKKNNKLYVSFSTLLCHIFPLFLSPWGGYSICLGLYFVSLTSLG